jgi:hypothetical protein
MRSNFVKVAAAAVACAGLVGGLGAVPAAAATAALPGWVKPPLVVDYVEDLGGRVDYDYQYTVTSVSGGVVDWTSYHWSPDVPGTTGTTYWSCSAVCEGLAAQASAQFWVDPKHPVESLSGGKWPYRYMGVSNYHYRGKLWRVGALYYADAHGPIVTYFQASTGLVLYHKEYGYYIPTATWYPIQLYYSGQQG